ncbi:MAG: MlaC/ttg2D family ABC transporter substrate-binding protein, partial [Alphaproteobacteria bacterium]
ALALPAVAFAGQSPEAETFIQNLADEAVTILSDKNISEAEKISRFDVILSRDVDMGRVGRFVLGRYWRGLPEAELNTYLETYQDYLIHSNAARLSAYAGDKIVVKNSVPDARDQFIVQSEVPNDQGSPFKIDWRVRVKDGEMKVVDIIVEGISMALTQRDEFAGIMQRSGGKIDPLMVRMKKVIGNDA